MGRLTAEFWGLYSVVGDAEQRVEPGMARGQLTLHGLISTKAAAAKWSTRRIPDGSTCAVLVNRFSRFVSFFFSFIEFYSATDIQKFLKLPDHFITILKFNSFNGSIQLPKDSICIKFAGFGPFPRFQQLSYTKELNHLQFLLNLC